MLFFADDPSGARKHSQFCPCKLPIFTSKKRCIARKLIFTIRAVLLCEHVDLVAGHFDGTAWRCSNRNNISTMEEALRTALCQRRRALHPCGDPDRFQTTGLTSADSSNCIGKSDFTALSPPRIKLQACVQPIKAATTRHGFTSTSSTGAAHNHIMKDRIDEFS